MGKALSFLKPVGKVFGIDPSGQADAIRDAANQQAAAERAAADAQAQATRDAAAAQSAQVNQQAQAVAQAQQATINQSTIANQIAAQQSQQQPQTQIDLTANTADDSSDPRRKYQGGASSVGGTNGGVGIRLT
ncbi:hypothetical protein KZJ38_07510 [Paraburkholderia edwinii]|uniref:Uncharacterized protein n=1 Tax=Paraburkholderia edwinii TaxID=2861782 RepID=A0ABX8USE3_9BURK|nr:hypothetical protein [Paraburkholderia edwinii]QYD70145.1 hypothetical protein KZJ38_07510 [Paraburkholderia edwinii]